MSNDNKTFSGSPHSAQDPNATVVASKPDDVFNTELNAQMAKRTDKLADNNIDMAIRVKQAREFMAWSASHLRDLWLNWMDESEKASHQMNLFRMAFDRETKSITASAKDITAFFNSTEYVASHERLKEMLGMLDRFNELKQNGTLDAFSDFILKVSCNNHLNT